MAPHKTFFYKLVKAANSSSSNKFKVLPVIQYNKPILYKILILLLLLIYICKNYFFKNITGTGGSLSPRTLCFTELIENCI